MNYKECLALLKETIIRYKLLRRTEKILYHNPNTHNSKAYYELQYSMGIILSEIEELEKLKELLEPPIISLKPQFNGYKQTN